MNTDVIERAFELAREGFKGQALRSQLRSEGYGYSTVEAYLMGKSVRVALRKAANSAAKLPLSGPDNGAAVAALQAK